ncbi:putative tfiiic transcription initiation factor complex subunits tfc3 [Erysiphe necator]|uniref:Putative tfiiic transcription initiation factor complex subunits tfc3 n=1 Tax=Uncinula necator TaxID=52586 RepID=A0A0B1P038_UNCNE|nr:putative tfiiic transcription initiation factor complex subunits tfc3 [Erysiphe necator]
MEQFVEVVNCNNLTPRNLSGNEEGNTPVFFPNKSDMSSKKGTYTTYEQVRYEAGLTGVYINPKPRGSAEPTRGRPVKRPRFVVFRSERLRDPLWLEKRRGTWHNYVAEAITSQIIEAENITQAAQKRKAGELNKQSIEEEIEINAKKRKVIKKHDISKTKQQNMHQRLEPIPPQGNSRNNELTPSESNNLLSQNSSETSAFSVPLETSQSHCERSNLISVNLRATRTSNRGSSHNEANDCIPNKSNSSHHISPYTEIENKNRLNNQKTSLGYPSHEQYLNQWTSLDQPNYMAQNLLSKNPHQNNLILSTNVTSNTNVGTLQVETAAIQTPISGRVTRKSSSALNHEASQNLHSVSFCRGYQPVAKRFGSNISEASSLSPSEKLNYQQPKIINQNKNCHWRKSPRNIAFQESEKVGNSIDCEIPSANSSSREIMKREFLQFEQQQDLVPLEKNLKRPRSEVRKKSRTPESSSNRDPDLDLAEAINFSPELDRLTCRYKGKAGNLLLSANKQCLEFLPIDQDCTEDSLFRLEISRIQNHPITSIAGSEPMELRFKAIGQDNTVNVHIFEFSSAVKAIEAASTMRAKIVTGIVACKFRSGEDYNHLVEIQEESQKPFKCESCQKRFKNQNGLEYHVSKAATTCNPNFDPQVGPGKRGRKKRRRTPDPTSANTQPGSVISPSSKPRYIGHETSNDSIESTNESSTFSSSDDSVIKWAMQNSSKMMGKSQGKRTTKASSRSVQKNQISYKSLPREAEALSKIVEESTSITSEVKLSFPQVEFANVIPNVADQAPLSGTLDMARYESILLSLIRENNGVFPGDKSLWFACFGAWLKLKLVIPTVFGETIAPESKFCSQLIDDLVESRKLRRHDLKFQDKNGRQASRYFLSFPGTKLNWSLIRETQKLIKKTYPDFYVPPQFSPPESVLSKLRDLTYQSISRPTICDKSEENIYSNSRQSSVSSKPDDLNSNQNKVFNNENPEKPKSKINNMSRSSPVISKLDNENRIKSRNLKISEGLRRYHQSLAKNPKTCRAAERDKSHRKTKTPGNLDNVSNQSDNCPVSTLPDLGRRARSQTHSKFTKSSRTSLKYDRTLPDFVVYLQDPNSSWSIEFCTPNMISIYLQSLQVDEPSHLESPNLSAEGMYNLSEKSLKPKVPDRESRKSRTTDKAKLRLTEMHLQSDVYTNEDMEIIKPSRSGNTLGLEHDNENITQKDTESESESDSDYTIPSIQKNNSNKATKNLCEMDILTLYEPKKLGSKAARNPGLETLPSNFSQPTISCDLIEPLLDFSGGQVMTKVISPQIVDSQCNFDKGSWTVVEFFEYREEKYNPRFDERTAFDIETLPYRDLCFALSIEETVPITSYARIQEEAKIARRKQSNSCRRLKFTRLLTHLNIDFWGIGCRPEISSKYLGIPMTAGDEIAKLRKRNSHDSMSLMVEKRFIVAVIVIRTLTGGIECLTDWVLVSLLFPRFSLNFIRGHWKQLVIRHKKAIDRLEIDFQNAFVPAYESGKIQTLDYDNLQDYNWNKLVDWTMNTIDTSFSHKPVSIPRSRDELKNQYALEISDSKDSWRDKCFETNVAIYKRLDYACFNSLVMPVKDLSKTKNECESTELIFARSWIRALALSPEVKSLNKTSQKFSKKIGEKALSELIESKVIMYRSKKRVNLSYCDYEATEMFSRPLRREVKPKCFRDASVFKRYLDSEFRKGKSHVRIDYMAWDGDVMVISNLQAHNRIQLQAIDVPREKFGLTEGGYETKKIPRERLRFEMDIYPTSTYTYDDENLVVLKALNAGPPRGNQIAIPVWYNTSETVISSIWKDVFSAVAQVIALRAGVNIPELTRIFTPTMEEWEIRLLLAWGEEIGLFCRLHEKIDGWIAGEWWWAYAMSLFSKDRFTAGQDVRYEPKDPFTMEGRRAV